MFRKTLISLLALAFVLPHFGAVAQEHSALGSEIPKDTTRRHRVTDRLFIPSGEIQGGLQMAYASLSGDNSELMLLLNGMDAKASFAAVMPFVSYAYKDNRVFGVRLTHSSAKGSIDKTTISLLNDGLEFDLSDLMASTRSLGVSAYHRTYHGLDSRGVCGLFYDVVMGYHGGRSQFAMGDPSGYTRSSKLKLSFSPGFELFLMNNVSLQLALSLADLSYTSVKYIEDETVVGRRSSFKVSSNLNLMGLYFGMTIHL